MAADPTRTLNETVDLVKRRDLDAYAQVARMLADLREAIAGTDRSGVAEQHARQLKANNPTLHHLTAALRGKGFLKK